MIGRNSREDVAHAAQAVIDISLRRRSVTEGKIPRAMWVCRSEGLAALVRKSHRVRPACRPNSDIAQFMKSRLCSANGSPTIGAHLLARHVSDCKTAGVGALSGTRREV